MKKKLLPVMFLGVVLLVVACSSGDTEEADERTLGDFIQAFESEGVEIDPEEKPLFQMIGATDGVIFYVDNSPVSIYEYESVKAVEDAQKDNSLMADWPKNGKFLLESNKEEAKDIFLKVE